MRRFGSLYLWSQAAKVLSFIVYACGLLLVERVVRALVTLATFFVPNLVLTFITARWRACSKWVRRVASAAAPPVDETTIEAPELLYDAQELVQARGYPFEKHFAETTDGFLIGLHRIPHGKARGQGGEPGVPRPVAFIMHGFLQSSEAFLATRENLPFQLADAGFDVWLGNARGNKYSATHRTLKESSTEYWNFSSIDDIASKDLPTTLTYITQLTGQPTVSYIGFSQGTAVAFACFSTRFDIAAKVNSFVALAPAATAKGFSQPLLDSIAKMSPDFIYFLLGRHSLFGSLIYFWQNLLTNAQFVKVIDCSVLHLFGWTMARVHPEDKPVLYSHIYSTSSVKSVVHWFKIMASQQFQMYEEGYVTPATPRSPVVYAAEGSVSPRCSSPPCSSPSPGAVGAPPARASIYTSRVAATYPLHQVPCPIHVMWGTNDHLPDTAGLLAALPLHATSQAFEGYEHLDFIYAREALRTVFPLIIERIKRDTATAAAKRATTFTPIQLSSPMQAPIALLPSTILPQSHLQLPHSRSQSQSLHSRTFSSSQSDRASSPTPSQMSSLVGADDDRCGSAFGDSSMATLFATAVLKRDGSKCVVCRSEHDLVAAHIVPLSCERTEAALESARLLHGFETTNGLTLCAPCHAAWERGLFYINPTDARSLVVSQALPPMQPEWLPRVGGYVHTPMHFKRHWPTPRVLAVHQTFAEQEWRSARQRYLTRLTADEQEGDAEQL